MPPLPQLDPFDAKRSPCSTKPPSTRLGRSSRLTRMTTTSRPSHASVITIPLHHQFDPLSPLAELRSFGRPGRAGLAPPPPPSSRTLGTAALTSGTGVYEDSSTVDGRLTIPYRMECRVVPSVALGRFNIEKGISQEVEARR